MPSETGLRVEGTGLEVSFGRAYEGAVAAVSKIEGPLSIAPATPPDCGEVVWKSGLVMSFVDGAFSGWAMGGQRRGDFCPINP